jgi:VanZ family protein
MRLRRIPLVCLAVLFLSMVAIGSLPGEAHVLSSRFGDKALHSAAYALISVLANLSLIVSRNTRAVSSVILVGCLGLLDESIQRLLPYRNASLSDWCFDMAAAIVVASFFWLLEFSTARTTHPETSHEKKNQQGRISCCRTWHTLSSSHQGQPERDAAHRGQATDPVCGGGSGCGRYQRNDLRYRP